MLSVAEEEDVDAIIVGGDIIPHYLPDPSRLGVLQIHANYIEDIFIPAIWDFKNRRNVAVYMDLGNDDFICNRKIFEQHDGELFHLIHLAKKNITDYVDIIGYMIVPPTPFKLKDWEKPDSIETPFIQGNRIIINGYTSKNGLLEETNLNLASDDTIENDLQELSKKIKKPFVFVSHSPPYHTPLDIIYNGLNVGSISIRRFIEKWSQEGLLIASFHGHIHESPIRSGSIQTKIGNTMCINPGQESGADAAFQYIIFKLSKEKIFLDV